MNIISTLPIHLIQLNGYTKKKLEGIQRRYQTVQYTAPCLFPFFFFFKFMLTNSFNSSYCCLQQKNGRCGYGWTICSKHSISIQMLCMDNNGNFFFFLLQEVNQSFFSLFFLDDFSFYVFVNQQCSQGKIFLFFWLKVLFY